MITLPEAFEQEMKQLLGEEEYEEMSPAMGSIELKPR